MIKALLSVYHRTLPPTMNVTTPNPCIEWDSSPLELLVKGKPWEAPAGMPRVAGVSAFGFGGTNFHIVVQEHVPELRIVSVGRHMAKLPAGRDCADCRFEDRPAVNEGWGDRETASGPTDEITPDAPTPFVVPNWPTPPGMDVDGQAWVIGGSDGRALARTLSSAAGSLTATNFREMADRLRDESSGLAIRCAFAAKTPEEAVAKLNLIRDSLADPQKRAFLPAKGVHLAEGPIAKANAGVAFLFPGQGSQYPYMLRDLAQRFPIVAQTFAEADEGPRCSGATSRDGQRVSVSGSDE